ncbi:DUF262 domain-containing protein [Chloroflexota bacterium]
MVKTMNDTSGERLTFYGIFKDKGYSVEIPIIQRDYAQGRASASQVRRNFLSSLYNCLKNDEPIDLDFIYGSISNGKFIPLDGQQRLTTLFLLHWYIASKEGELESFKTIISNDNKSRFSYETRITSRDFCSALVINGVLIPSSDMNLSDVIKDAHWFYISWEKDPTIKSMLVMLDAIHEMFAESSNFYEKLLSPDKPLISFQFIELKNFGLSDSLYIKMNARGIELTAFENFKAKFEQLLEKHDIEHSSKLKDEFALKIDTVWPDIFWKYRDPDTHLYDKKIMNFIRILATNEYALKPENENSENLRSLITSRDLSFYDFEEYGCFVAPFFLALINTLDALSNDGINGIKEYLPDNQLLAESELFQKAIDNNMSYPERIQLFALYNYLNKYCNDEQLNEWIRIIRNLTENTRIDEISDYVAALKSVNEILSYGNEIVLYIAESSNEIKGFATIQVEEERIKALLILKNDEWKQAIIKIENHGYFKGQIGFILNFSGITNFFKENGNFNWSVQDDQFFLKLFLEYSEKAESIFDLSGLNKFDGFLFERALLCKGDYTLNKGMNYSFLIDSDRDIGWKRLLRDDNDQRTYVKELFNNIGTTQIEIDLQKIVNDSNVTDWRKYFIEYPEMIMVCGWNKFIRFESQDDILLLERTQTNGFHREYYSYALDIRLKRMGNRVFYHSDISVDYPKFINEINGNEIEISYNGQYVVKHNGTTNNYDSQDDVITYLINENILV